MSRAPGHFRSGARLQNRLKVLYLFTFTVILVIDSSIYLSIIQSPTSSLSAIPVIMLLDANWQYAFIALLLHPRFTLCKGKSNSGEGSSSRSGSCTWKIYGWLGLGLFVGVLVLIVSVPVSRREIQAEGGCGTAMTEGIMIDDKHSVYTSRRRCNLKGFNTEDAQYKGSKIAKTMLIF